MKIHKVYWLDGQIYVYPAPVFQCNDESFYKGTASFDWNEVTCKDCIDKKNKPDLNERKKQ